MKDIKKGGFTLIELLAVIIILGVLMIIAIPSVTSYINDSRKTSYIDTAKSVISGARTMVNTGKLGMYSTDTTYYIPASCISTENALKTPYGEFTNAYVVITYDGKGYLYYWISVDTSRQGIKDITPLDKLDSNLIESDIDSSLIQQKVDTTGIEGRGKILILNSNNCSDWQEEKTATSNLNNQGEITVVPLKFKLDGIDFNFEQGMTWGDWLNSDYNPYSHNGFSNDILDIVYIDKSSYLCTWNHYLENYKVIYDGENKVSLTSQIENKKLYNAKWWSWPLTGGTYGTGHEGEGMC